MTKEIWLNLPVKDLQKSIAFFKAIGFSFNEQYSHNGVSAALQVGSKNFIVMLFVADVLADFAQHPLTDTSKSCELLISFDAESTTEVDEMARKAEAAGANVFAKPAEIQGWMYGCAFADLDGHRWNMLYMDMSKTPKS